MESDNLSGIFADRYTIERTLGRGASASVYLAHDNKQDREIALKVLNHDLANALGSQRFLQEIRITSRLQHPHILPIHDSGEWEGLLYYTLPFVAGESLRARLDREKQLPVEECVQLTCDVASALAHAHAKGVIHRDIKPENILLSDGHALVADFGIARSTEIQTGERLTSSGLIVGTSQYMSPEQAAGEREIDARSDIYSLGCVLYEMLAGIEPFVGPNVQAIIAQRFKHAPRPVTTFRPTVPEGLAAALEKSLAISAADRFQTMKDFATALPPAAPSPNERRRMGRTIRDALRSRNGKLIAASTVALIAVGAAAAIPARNGVTSFFAPTPSLDTALFVVIPVTTQSATKNSVDTDAVDRMAQTLQSWQVKVVSDAKLSDAIGKSGLPRTPAQAVALARSLGAGRMIGFSGPAGNRVKLYDVQSQSEISIASLASPDSVAVDRALMNLLKDPHRPSTADGGDGKTSSFAAWRAYGAGHLALKKWSLQKALTEFSSAIEADPAFVPARLWKAQLSMWQVPADSMTWARDAKFAAAQSGSLSPRDALIARGLNALGQRDYPAACSEYAKLTKVDSLDFIGWFGLGECRSLDLSVIASGASRSGWIFRSSFRQAAADYLRAVRLDPGASIISYSQIARILPVSPTLPRRGTDSHGSIAFAAYPSLENDTLAFVPYPLKTFSALAAPASRNDALDRNARNVYEFATSWTEADPRNPDAFQELAAILEARGEITSGTGSRLSASDAVRKALSLSRSDAQRIKLGTTEVRLRIKRREFSSAAQLADSILARSAESPPSVELIALSGFTGKVNRMAREAARKTQWVPTGGGELSIAPHLMTTAAELFARAALGLCGSATSALQSRLGTELESYVAPDKRELARHRLTTRSNSMLTPCTNGASALLIGRPEAALYRAQQAFAGKNFRLTRLLLDSVAARRTHMRPGDVSLDQTYQEAWLRSALGDASAAVKQLDLALNALPTLSASTLNEPAAAAAVARAMHLRIQLAARLQDSKTAQMWSSALSQLLQGADPEVRAMLTSK